MKRILFSIVAAILSATVAYAQDVYVATLNHEGTITEFYGAASIDNALSNAVDGDIITLSEGVFTSAKTGTSGSLLDLYIKKAVTIRGAGMADDNVHGTSHTIISVMTRIQGSGMTIEGVEFPKISFDNANNATFTKCRLSVGGSWKIDNSIFTNCVYIGPTPSNNTFNNCFVSLGSNAILGNVEMFNSFIALGINAVSTAGVVGSNFTNCVISTPGLNLPASNKLANCVGISTNTSKSNNIFINIPEQISSTMVPKSIFMSWDDAISTTNLTPESYELSDEGKAYIGADGTEIGMLGGNYPYNPVVSIPRITKCEVANKATADGKLSVNIEVTAPTAE